MASNNKKYLKLSLILIVPVLLYFGFQYANTQLERFAIDAIKEVAIGKKGEGYFVNFQHFNIYWSESKLDATGITILPNAESENDNWVNASIDTIVIEFSHLYSGLLLGNIQVKEFSMIKPNLQYFWKEKKEEDKNEQDEHHSPIPKFEVLGKRLNKIGISGINIIDVTFNGYLVMPDNQHQHIFHTTQNIQLSGINFHLDERKEEDIIDIEKIAYNVGPTFMKAYGKLYEYEFDSLWVSDEDNSFSIHKFNLRPQSSPEVFFKRVGKQTDMMSISLDSMLGNGFDANSLFKHNVINLDELTLDGAEILIYRDKNYEEDTTVFKKLPHRLLQTIDYSIKLDKFALNHSTLTYKEKSKNAKQPGTISIKDINLLINNINTDLKKNIHLDLKCKLFSKRNTHISLDLNTSDQASHFLTGHGKIPAFSMYHLNKFTHPNMGVLFQKGEVVDINFDIKMNDKIGRGNLDFYYKDLKLKLIGKNDNKTNFVESLTGFAANSLAYNKNLPGKHARHAPLYFERVPYKSVVHYVIHTILSGAETAVIGTYGQLPHKERKAYKNQGHHHRK